MHPYTLFAVLNLTLCADTTECDDSITQPPGPSVGLCERSADDGFTENYRLFYGANATTWHDARSNCHALDMDLVMITSESIKNALIAALKEHG